MCGIFGYIDTKGKGTRNLAKRLFLLSESRGMEASGFLSLTPSHATLFKTPDRGSVLIKSKTFRSLFTNENEERYRVFIGHSRLATNGGAEDNRNNQPLVADRIGCVHNGIIVNAAELRMKYGTGDRSQNSSDSQVIPMLFSLMANRGGNPVRAVRMVFDKLVGAASVCLAPLDGNWCLLATNTGSLYAGTSPEGSFVFASEAFILKNIRASGIRHIPSDTGLLVCYEPFSAAPFSLNEAVCPEIQRKSVARTYADHSEYVGRIHAVPRLNNLQTLRKHEPDYKAIRQIRRCTRCILPETMPLISFDSKGVCNYCRTYSTQNPSGPQGLRKYVEPFKSTNKDHDCIVALSGGRDSSYGLHYAKTVLGLNPIAYTYDWGMVTDVARRNQSRLTAALGVEHIIVSADIPKKRANIRKNVLAWLRKPDIAMVPLFMAGDKQAEYYAEKLKEKTGIRLIIYSRGNQLEDERFKFGYYGIFDGTPRGVIHDLSPAGKLRMAAYFASACIKNPGYLNSSLIDTASAFASSYLIPHRDFVYLWHHIPWEEDHVVSTLRKTYGWESASDTVATWRIDDGTPPFYNYIYHHIQGFTEHDGLRSNQIREGHISRKNALLLTEEENRPRYESLAWYFDTIGIDGNRALSVVDRIKTKY